MAIFNRLTQDEIERDFTHYGWFAGLVPVYIHEDPAHPILERNWVPEPYFYGVFALFSMFLYIASFLDPYFEAQFPILITKRIKQ